MKTSHNLLLSEIVWQGEFALFVWLMSNRRVSISDSHRWLDQTRNSCTSSQVLLKHLPIEQRTIFRHLVSAPSSIWGLVAKTWPSLNFGRLFKFRSHWLKFRSLVLPLEFHIKRIFYGVMVRIGKPERWTWGVT